MKNNLFNSFSNIDDDLLDMTAKKIKYAKPRKIALRATGFVAAAAAVAFTVNLGVSLVDKLPMNSQSALSSSQGKEFNIDYNNLPFKCSASGRNTLAAKTFNDVVASNKILCFDESEIPEIIGNTPWNESYEITELPVFDADVGVNLTETDTLLYGTGIVADYAENGGIDIMFPVSSQQILPSDYIFNGETYVNYTKELAEKYSYIIGYDDFEIDAKYSYDNHGVKSWNVRAYKAADNSFEAILNYSFTNTSFSNDEEIGYLKMNMKNILDKAGCYGFYPTMSVEKARELLLSDEDYLDGLKVTEDQIKYVDLAYCENKFGISMPTYRFVVQSDKQPENLAEGLKCYDIIYVNAISPEYLINNPKSLLASYPSDIYDNSYLYNKYQPFTIPSKVPELDPKYFEQYQTTEFTIDYDNLPFVYKNEGLTKHDARPVGLEYDAFVKYAYDASELVGNNPWNENLEIERLPIFRKKARNIECSDLEKTTEAVKQMNDENDLNLLVDGSAEDGINIRLPEEKYTDFTAKELAEQYKTIAEKYGKLVGLDDAEFSMVSTYSLIGRKFYNAFFYQSSDNAFEAIMNYNFKQVRITEYGYSFEKYYYGYGEPSDTLTLNYTNRFDTLQCSGFYPIITVQKAKEQLYNGKYYATFDNSDVESAFKAAEDKIKSVELVYLDTYSDESLPYYRFIVEIDGLEDETKLHAEGIKRFINVFVPAIDSAYISY